VRQQAQFRFNAAKMELRRVLHEYDVIMARFEWMNPGLAKQIKSVIDGILREGEQ
jgi:hypothetical protein